MQFSSHDSSESGWLDLARIFGLFISAQALIGLEYVGSQNQYSEKADMKKFVTFFRNSFMTDEY